MSTEEEMEMIDQLLTQGQSSTQESSDQIRVITSGVPTWQPMPEAIRQYWTTSSNEWSGWLETTGAFQQQAIDLAKYYNIPILKEKQEPESFNFFKALKLTK